MGAADLNILGKDYLTQEEAAHYCCMSLRQFQEVSAGYGIRCGRFGGKLLYRRADLQGAIEREWRAYEKLTAPTSSTGTTRKGKGTEIHSGASASSPSATPTESSSKSSSNSQPATTS